MKKNCIGRLLIGLLMAFGLVSACQTESKEKAHSEHSQKEYTCPMHPQIVQDHPGQCPICSMDLVTKVDNNELVVDSSLTNLVKPVNAHVLASIPLTTAQTGTRIFTVQTQGIVTYDNRSRVALSSRVAGRIERLLVKYNYQPVNKGQLIMEIYSPDLAAAQRELLMLARDSQGSDLLAQAKQRLLLLGMSSQQIEKILQTGEILYRVPLYSPASGYILEQTASAPQASTPMPDVNAGGTSMDEMGGSSSPVASTAAPQQVTPDLLLRPGQYVTAGQSLFTIYKSERLIAEFALPPAISARVKVGHKLLFYAGSERKTMMNASVGLIEPVIRSGQSFTVARVYLKGQPLNPGQILTASIPIVFENSLWLHRKAVWQTGNRSTVFKHQQNALVPKSVKTGPLVDGWVQIQSDIHDWKVASNASYLVDSESFIKDQTIVEK